MSFIVAASAVITALGGLVGVTKNSFELRNTVKEVFKDKRELNKAYDGIKEGQKKIVENLNEMLKSGRHFFISIVKKLIIRYISALVILIILLVLAIILLNSLIGTFLEANPYFLLILFIISYLLTAKLLSNPLQTSLKLESNTAINKLYEEIKRYNFTKTINQNVLPHINKLSKIVRLSRMITPGEVDYLQLYIDVTSLRDTFEMYWISEKLINIREELFNTGVFYEKSKLEIAGIIERYISNNDDILNYKDLILTDIKNAGFETLIPRFNDIFFEKDFKGQYAVNGRQGIADIIGNFWFNN